MSYNGVGLTTARGSGTNGYVQRNFAAVRHRKEQQPYQTEEDWARRDRAMQRAPNKVGGLFVLLLLSEAPLVRLHVADARRHLGPSFS